MSQSNGSGVIRIGRKGLKEFAFGDEGTPGSEPFKIDVVTTFQHWLILVDSFRGEQTDDEGNHLIPREVVPTYHQAAIEFVEGWRCPDPEARKTPGYQALTTTEALEFTARLREEYDRLADFFQYKSSKEQDKPATLAPATSVQYSEEPQASNSAPSTS